MQTQTTTEYRNLSLNHRLVPSCSLPRAFQAGPAPWSKRIS